jgi:hypothetical protein
MGFPLYSFLEHPQLYYMPSPANSQWHLWVQSIVTPMMCPINCSNDSSSSKSWGFDTMSFKLVLGFKTPYVSFFPSIIFFPSAYIGKPCSLQSCCRFFAVTLVSMPLSASCFSNSFFLSFLFFIPSNKTSWCFFSRSWAFR